jgi:DNA-binding LacI/PurR family transcriptional regulator
MNRNVYQQHNYSYQFLNEEGTPYMVDSVTVKDVAREASVSVGTVSRVFNNHSNVSGEIRDRVLKAAAEVGYNRLVAKDPPMNNHRPIKEIGFLFYSPLHNGTAMSNPFWPHILNGVEREARQSHIKVIYQDIGEAKETPQELFSTIQNMKLGGILLVGPTDLETVRLLKRLTIPIVLIANYVPGISVHSVVCDELEGALIAMHYLIKRGHRQIAFIDGSVLLGSMSSKFYAVERRKIGYRTALIDAGLPVVPELIEQGDLGATGGYQACQRLLRRNIPFTALFCANDETAIGAMQALREAGRRIPEDVSIIGFDDIAMAAHLTPALTTIRVNKDALGSIAVKQLLELAKEPSEICTSTVLEVELIERDSVISFPSST